MASLPTPAPTEGSIRLNLNCLVEAFWFLFRERQDLLVKMAGLAVALGALGYVGGSYVLANPEVLSPAMVLSSFLVWLAFMIAYLLLTLGLFRLQLRPDLPFIAPMRVMGGMLWFTIKIIGLLLIMMVPVMIVMIGVFAVTGVQPAPENEGGLAEQAIGFIVAILFASVVLRLYPAMPAIAIGRPTKLREAWQATRGQTLGMVVVFILFYLLFSLLPTLLVGLLLGDFLPIIDTTVEPPALIWPEISTAGWTMLSVTMAFGTILMIIGTVVALFYLGALTRRLRPEWIAEGRA